MLVSGTFFSCRLTVTVKVSQPVSCCSRRPVLLAAVPLDSPFASGFAVCVKPAC